MYNCVYINIYMLAMAGETARKNWLFFLKNTVTLGVITLLYKFDFFSKFNFFI